MTINPETGQEDGPSDWEACLRRAFVDSRMEVITLDSWEARKPFLRDSVEWGIDEGILMYIEATPAEERAMDEAQCTVWRYSLTDKGRKHFGLEVSK